MMKRPFSLPFLLIVLILHAGLIALAMTELPIRSDNSPQPVSIAVQILPAEEKAAPISPAPPEPLPAPPVPAPLPPPPEPEPERKVREVKPAPKPRPKPAPKPRAAREPASPDIKVPSPAPVPVPPTPSTESAQSSPPAIVTAPLPASAVPAPPVRTGVYTSAEHAATNAKPAYPAMSKRYGEQGTVVLRVLVNADGSAGQVEIRTSSGYPLLDESARTAVQRWRFRPATVDGKPVADWYLQSIPFKLQN